MCYDPWKWLGNRTQPSPGLSLRTVNIVADDAAIIQACEKLDLVAIRKLFDEGQASPYDVDNTGRNLLGAVAIGCQVSTCLGSTTVSLC